MSIKTIINILVLMLLYWSDRMFKYIFQLIINITNYAFTLN